jgi:hypothetical protein
MPSSNPSLRAAETSEELEILRAHSVNYSDKAAEVLSNAIGQLKFVLYALTKLAGGGKTEEEQDAFLRISWLARKGCICRASIFSRRLGPLMA